MRRVTISKLCLSCMVVASLLLNSCMEKDLYDPNSNGTPSSATFATTQDVQFAMQYSVPTGYNAGFEVYAENPIQTADNGTIVLRTDVQPIAAGIAESGSFNLKKRIPGYVKELYALSSDLFAPTLMYAKIESGIANFQVKSIETTTPMQAAMTTRSTTDLGLDFIPTMDSKHTPTPDGTIEVPTALMAAISKAFPEGYTYINNAKAGKSPIAINPDYVKEASLEIREEAELWVTPLLTNCTMTNTFGYICYDGPKSDLAGKSIKDINEKLRVVLPFASLEDNPMSTMAGQTNLKKGDAFKLKYFDKTKQEWVDKFPKNSTVIWFLWAGKYKKETGSWNNNPSVRNYSHAFWNTDDLQQVHTSYYGVKLGETTHICFGFEDQRIAPSDKDYNDLIFMMKSNPETAIVPPPLIDVDPITTQTEERKGILAYEDNWPWEGDYDMNDVITKYKSITTYTKETNKPQYVSKVEDVFTIIHNGATFHNSFSIKYDISPSAVESVSVSSTNGTSSSYRTDENGNGFIIDVCPDVTSILPSFSSGNFPYNITINFKAGSLPGDENYQLKLAAPYNPYISPKTGIEVHLPNYAPTGGANEAYFNTQSDCSRPEKNIYYVGKEGSVYPFAIHLSGVEDFETTEMVSIDQVYPRYKTWVKSTTTPKADADWYIK